MEKIMVVFFIFILNFPNCQILKSDEIFNTIVLIKENIGNKQIHGTGFLLSQKNMFFLVTAKHVADSLHLNFAEIYLRDSLSKSVKFSLKDLIPNEAFIKYNDKSDFFIVEIVPFDLNSKSLVTKNSIDVSHLANDRNSIDRKIDLIVFGYPIFDLNYFSPITFKSNFSSSLMNIYMDDFKKSCFCYLLEQPSAKGFSGGPVFAGINERSLFPLEKTLIVGIVTGTTFDATGGKYAIITPTFHLLDLINQ